MTRPFTAAARSGQEGTPPPLPIAELTQIAEAVALEFNCQVAVDVVSSVGGGRRAELLLTKLACREEPCRLMVNVDRANREQFERDVRAAIREALSP